ncbi:quinol:cytochrome C oxidoreductase [Longibacter salinarum]|uniref:Quinol:cytochrome C oxidoreductase n=1 Tax=Longibacter salinarum TaxID=1850348 RepID=A0A2A8D130_9BACT|nr:cytochrome c [Longibacter salinarum]PEN14358.1 quinol:cytochrome C oxidoreductase [Longibacter salinarum]
MRNLLTTGLILSVLLLAGCRGTTSDRNPIHPNPNMDWQPKYQAQEKNTFFADEAAMRKPVAGTVARGLLKEDPIFYTGRTEAGDYVERLPIETTRDLLERGKERYEIFCAVCHGKSGDGNGVIMVGGPQGKGYGYTPAPSYHVDRLRQVSDGYLYDVIANGIRNMPGYAQQIPVRDRWAIVAYIKALQLSQNATREDLTSEQIARIQSGRSANIDGSRSGASSSQ